MASDDDVNKCGFCVRTPGGPSGASRRAAAGGTGSAGTLLLLAYNHY